MSESSEVLYLGIPANSLLVQQLVQSITQAVKDSVQVPEGKLLITVEEAAELLGISEARVRGMANAGSLPGVVRNEEGAGKILFKRAVLVQWASTEEVI